MLVMAAGAACPGRPGDAGGRPPAGARDKAGDLPELQRLADAGSDEAGHELTRLLARPPARRTRELTITADLTRMAELVRTNADLPLGARGAGGRVAGVTAAGSASLLPLPAMCTSATSAAPAPARTAAFEMRLLP